MNDEIDLTEYFTVVRRHWGWALIGFIIVLGMVLAFTFMSKPTYEARSLIMITNQDQANFLLGGATIRATDLETQKVIVTSPNVMYPVYHQYNQDSFSLSVNAIKNSNIIELRVEAHSPEEARDIANQITKSYLAYTVLMKKQDANGVIEFINQQITMYDTQLKELEAKALAYASDKNATKEQKEMYQSIQREIAAKNKIYDFLLTKREEAGLAADANSGTIKVISYAEVQLDPIKPNVPLNIVLGLALAVCAGFGTALAANTVGKKFSKKRI